MHGKFNSDIKLNIQILRIFEDQRAYAHMSNKNLSAVNETGFRSLVSFSIKVRKVIVKVKDSTFHLINGIRHSENKDMT